VSALERSTTLTDISSHSDTTLAERGSGLKPPEPGDLIIATDVWDAGPMPQINVGDVIMVINVDVSPYGFSLCVMHKGFTRFIIADESSIKCFSPCNKPLT